MTVRILNGDCRDVLKTLPSGTVQCVVSSPPYFGLRDYGVAGQIGLEPTPEAFVAELVEVFREVRRVLRDDGTCWVNLGDSYAGSGRGGNPTEATSTLQGGQTSQRASMVKRGGPPSAKSTLRGNGHVGGGPKLHALAPVVGSQLPAGFHENARQEGNIGRAWVPPPVGLKQKDLVGAPWMVAFALRADGWYLRQDIIWHKPNPMPESIRDRCTKAHEYVFLLSKSQRYYFDQDAIRTPFSGETKTQSFDTMEFKARDRYKKPDGWDTGKGGHGSFHRDGREKGSKAPTDYVPPSGANKRSVWTVATEAFSEVHFATFPPALIEPCILAGCPVGGTVLDPFGGAGTTGLVADRLQRDAILIELNPTYAAMAERRIRGDAGMMADVETSIA